MPEAFSNLAAWQIVKKVTGYRPQVVMDRGTRDDRCAGTMDDVKTDGRGEMKEPRDDGTTAFGSDDRFARTMEAEQIHTSLVQTRWKMEAKQIQPSLVKQGFPPSGLSCR